MNRNSDELGPSVVTIHKIPYLVIWLLWMWKWIYEQQNLHKGICRKWRPKPTYHPSDQGHCCLFLHFATSSYWIWRNVTDQTVSLYCTVEPIFKTITVKRPFFVKRLLEVYTGDENVFIPICIKRPLVIKDLIFNSNGWLTQVWL